jgi:hypothetical protein
LSPSGIKIDIFLEFVKFTCKVAISLLRIFIFREVVFMENYFVKGERKALALGNRGPIHFGSDGRLSQHICEAYSRYGFYVFQSVLKTDELNELHLDIESMLERAPVTEGSELNQFGQKALGVDCKAPTFFWAAPLSDPFGGTPAAGGRHPVKMPEPCPDPNTPEKAIFLVLGSLQFSHACLRTYGHPELLRVAAAINGEDFTPFNEALFIKKSGIGASVAWHQDGLTHWDSDKLDEGTHGFNFMAQLYGSTARNGVWVVPGTHKLGKINIKNLVEAEGSPYLSVAVPMVCAPGDVVMSNRQLVHGSFANTGDSTRVTVNFGFHRKSSVLGVKAGGVHNAEAIYDAQRIEDRSRVIALAIDARRKRFPKEDSFCYKPFVGRKTKDVWNIDSLETLKDYNLLDLSI